MHIGDWLARRARLSPERVALIDTRGGTRLTYRQWDRIACRTARFLQERLGVRRGDRVAVLSTNRAEYLDVLFAVGKLGAVLQALNWRLLPGELAPLVSAAAPVALIYEAELGPQAERLRRLLPGLPFVALDAPAAGDVADFRGRDELPDDPPPEVEVAWDDPWVLCYTGGSTGRPRAAVLTHRSITANAVNTIVSWGLTAEDRAILDAPLFHTGGLNVFTTPLVYVGGSTVLCQRFQPEQTFDLWRDGGVTLYFGVPTMFLLLQQHPRWDGAELRSLRIVISGGAPCPEPVFHRFFERGVDFRTGYGLTEAGPNNFWLPAEHVRRKPGAVGAPLFHVDALLLAEDGSVCADGAVGELCLRGPHLFGGYLGDEAATAAALGPLPGRPDGPRWLRTGDLGRRDEDGHYTIVGRRKDMFISGGENVYPAEIEGVLHGHPAVAEAAVIGVPDDRWGEVGRALVVLRPGESADEAAIVAFLRARLAGYKVPRSVLFLGELPKTGANKVDKVRLRGEWGGP